MHWSAEYIGLPWVPGGRDKTGVDCYGLVRLVLRDVAGVEISQLSGRYVTAEERDEISSIIKGEMDAGPWSRVESARPLDILVFRCMGVQSHVGIVACDDLFLHSTSGRTSAIERMSDGRWSPRLTGIFRHRDLM